MNQPTNHANRLLAQLSTAELRRLERNMDEVSLVFKETLYEQRSHIGHVYFPTSGVVSLLTVLGESRAVVETGTIGREGFVGVPLLLGVKVAPGRAICQIPGTAVRMSASAFRAALDRSEELRAVLLRFTNALLAMVSQSAGCLASHPIDSRMARWLLQTQDRVGASEFPLTQEFLSQMLGVRRSAVNPAGRALQKAGLISYKRGKISILDRRGLERKSCECYERIREELARTR